MNTNFTFIRHFFITFLICFAIACTPTTDSGTNKTNNDDKENSGANSNNQASSSDIEKAVTRSEALNELFDNTTLGIITLTITQDQWDKMVSNTKSGNKKTVYVKSDFKYEKNGKTYEMNDIGVRNRGNSSYRAPVDDSGNLQQAHFKLKFDNFIDDDAHHAKKALKGINLKFMLNDMSYVQEVYSYDLFKRFGVWTAPRCSYAKLYIKIGDKEATYFGIYKAIEPVSKQFIKARIDTAKFSNDAGNLWKCLYQSGGPANLKNENLSNKIGVDTDSYTPVYSLKTNEENLNQEREQLITFIKDLNSKTDSDFETWIENAFDVDLFLKTLAVSVSCGMWDDYWRNSNNYYLYFNKNGKAFFIPYDYDNSLGATNDIMQDPAEKNPLEWGKDNPKGAPLVTKILAISKYKEKYKEYLQKLIDSSNGYFDVNSSKKRINDWYDLIREFSSPDHNVSTYFEKDGAKNRWDLNEGKPSDKYSLLSSSNNYFDLRTDAIIQATGGQSPVYTVTFDPNGGNFTGDNAGETIVTIEEVAMGKNPQDLVTAKKDGFTLLGWYGDNDEKVTKITFSGTLTAKWQDSALFGYSVDTESKKITFTFDPKMYGMTAAEIESVYIWGSFNGWKEGNNPEYPLTNKDNSGIFSGTFDLPSYGSEFKYGVNGEWKGAGDRLSDYALPKEYGTDNIIIKW